MVFSRRRLTACLLLSLAATACSSDQPTAPKPDVLSSKVRALGFSTQGMEDHGDYVVVEGDIVLDKKSLLREDNKTSEPQRGVFVPRTQYSTNQGVSSTNVRQIVVNLSNIANDSDWANAVRAAMADYNSTGSAVHMSEGSPGDITFSSISQFADQGTIAKASFPQDASTFGKPGPTVTVADNWNYLSVGQKEWVMVHELGHTIGLRHDNAAATEGSAGYGANLVPGTPQSDANSVMVPVFPGGAFSGFSGYDITALRSMYTPIELSISGPMQVTTQKYCNWTANASGGVPPYTYQWGVVNNSNIQPQSSSSQTFLAFTGWYASSSFTVYVGVTDSNGNSAGAGMYVSYTYYGNPSYCS